MSEAYDPASGEPEPAAIRVNAVWDTGATGSVINQEVISALGLQPIDKQKIYTANGERIAGVYLVNIHLANGVIFPGLRVSDGDILGSSVLIGMDIIGRGDFARSAAAMVICADNIRLTALSRSALVASAPCPDSLAEFMPDEMARSDVPPFPLVWARGSWRVCRKS